MKKAIILLLAIVMAWACSQQPPTTNGDLASVQVSASEQRSELALAMRDMYDKMKLVSDSMKAGHAVHTNFLERFEAIHAAKSTKPDMVDETYHNMADLFLTNYARFESESENQAGVFNAMIETCLACHQHQCPGPVKIIGKLRIN